MSNFDTAQFNELIHSRRSVYTRDYSGERVDDAIVLQMLENANWAPSHKLTEPWRFVVFTNDGLKKLADFQSACYKQVTTSNGTFDKKKWEGLKTKPLECSHIIAIGMKRHAEKGLPEWEELGAVFCAIENMYLTATVYGVGCYLSTGGITNFEEAKEFFGLEKSDRLVGFMHLGVPKNALPLGRRKSTEEKVTWIR
ncbi:MAG: nitroreductase [Bacteroidetes bacterium]|nr:nitroreductase [Bacteroidota bacterium]MBS1539136.1 nitroreductase [Bacteroidota bacterium]